MAYPTQITIASGKTVYAGDESDGITSRQVQVSVTYQLERADADLLHVTAVKAREVDAAQEVVWHHVLGDQTVQEYQTEMDLPPRPPSGQDDPSEDEDDPGPPPCDGDCPEDKDCPEDGEDQDDEDEGEIGDWKDDRADGYDGHGPAGPSPGDYPEPAVPSATIPGANASWERPMTKPQRLALHAQARRLGLSDQALADEIRERFGKSGFTPRYAVERLTKAEADALLRALAEREWKAARPERTAQV